MSDTKEPNQALAVIEERSVTEVRGQVNKIQGLMKDVMILGEHYGPSYPGDTKKNLLKPGADKLCFTFRLAAEYEIKRGDLPNGHREYEIITTLHDASGRVLAQGLGSASTMESKYRWRNAAKKCPNCGKEAIIKGKEEYGGGWVCFKKKDGCGSQFLDDDPKIIGQVTGKVENPDIADVYNTVLKIAKKRSYVDATITACAASDIFTQDAEDVVGDSPAKQAEDQHTESHQRPGNGSGTTQGNASGKPPVRAKSGPIQFMVYISIVNNEVPSADRPTWMQKARGGKDPVLLGQLADEIRAAYPAGQAAPPGHDSLRIQVAEFINHNAPDSDKAGLIQALETLADDQLEDAFIELKARYATA